MRAAQATLRRHDPAVQTPALPQSAGRADHRLRPMIGFSAMFLLGYLPGIWAGRNGQTALGQQLADYWLQYGSLSFRSGLSAAVSAAFLQLTAVLLCGFCAFGLCFCLLLFAARGLWLGFCAANVLAAGGSGALVLYRLLTCVADLSGLFLCLWLAAYALPVSTGLFRSIFCGGAPRGQLAAAARRLLVRYGTALILSLLFCLVNSGLGLVVLRLLG